MTKANDIVSKPNNKHLSSQEAINCSCGCCCCWVSTLFAPFNWHLNFSLFSRLFESFSCLYLFLSIQQLSFQVLWLQVLLSVSISFFLSSDNNEYFNSSKSTTQAQTNVVSILSRRQTGAATQASLLQLLVVEAFCRRFFHSLTHNVCCQSTTMNENYCDDKMLDEKTKLREQTKQISTHQTNNKQIELRRQVLCLGNWWLCCLFVCLMLVSISLFHFTSIAQQTNKQTNKTQNKQEKKKRNK